jgi:DnaK suppressor protein
VLSADELQHYKRALEKMSVDADTRIEELTAWCDPVEPDVALGRLTRMDAIQSQQMALHQRDRVRTQKTRIIAALDRIEKGTFGTCPACKKPIDKRRLDTAPDAPLCVACLEAHRARNP